MSLMCACSSVSRLVTDTEIGTSCGLCSRLAAVTVILSVVTSGLLLGAGGASSSNAVSPLRQTSDKASTIRLLRMNYFPCNCEHRGLAFAGLICNF